MGQTDNGRMHAIRWKRPSLGRLYSFRGSRQDSFRRRKRSSSSALRRTHQGYKMAEGGVQHAGYLDIKQPPRVKGRKLKSWKKKWVVLHEMSIRSAGDRSAAKVDVYTDEKTASVSPADKHSFILEFVTSVRPAKSKTHGHAFEIVENEAVLLLSGATELETQTWMAAFKKIFKQVYDDTESFTVELHDNEHTSRHGLKGSYQLSVSPEVVAIQSDIHNSYEWSLNMLKRFHVEKSAEHPAGETLVIESGPKSECGEAVFKFSSDHVTEILEAIKQNISIAINLKNIEGKSWQTTNNNFRSSVTSSTSGGSVERERTETASSTEQRYRDLLENASQKQTTVSMVTSQDSEQTNSEEPPELPKKKRHSVTFDTSGLNEPKAPVDLLSAPIEIQISENEATDYNHVDLSHPKDQKSQSAIVSMFTVAKPGYETKVLLDESGYSHVDIQDSKLVIVEDDKARSFSNMSTHSSVSGRSASVGSKDSGILNPSDKNDAEHKRGVASTRSSNSFDSAVSTSSTADQTNPVTNTSTLTVEIQEIEVSADDFLANTLIDCGENFESVEVPIYQDVSMEERKDFNEDNYSKPTLKKSSSTGNVEAENEYEDLNIYRTGKKNLVKHLGMDPTIDPTSVPPSLPERPTSHKLRRKSYTHDKRLFTLPFRSKKKIRERAASVSSSSSGSEDGGRDSKKGEKLSLKIWPLGNKSVMVDNDGVYQPAAIQRFLKDNEGVIGPQKRERSSSLNLNTANLTMKRPSIQSAKDFSVVDRKNAVWKHNRNVSMQMDMLNRLNEPDKTILNMNKARMTDLSFRPDMLKGDNEIFFICDDSITDDSNAQLEDEPIYAELEPTQRSGTGRENCDNPFPNLTLWTPQNMSDVAEVSELNATDYENDESLSKDAVGDVFNQGFVLEDTNTGNGKTKRDVGENLLIDLSDIPEADGSAVCADIFNIRVGPSYFDSIPILPAMNNGSSKPASHPNVPSMDSQTSSESIYMDMSTCKNESIYVLPSSLQHPEVTFQTSGE